MKEFIISSFFTIIFAILSWATKDAGKNKKELKEAIGVINNLSDHDGRVNYYVTIEEDGKQIKGKSISYPSSGKSYEIGDKVPITYYNTKNQWVRVIIQDTELKPSNESLRFVPIVFTCVAIIFFIVTAIYGIRLFLD